MLWTNDPTMCLPYFTMYIEVPVKFFNAYFSDAQNETSQQSIAR